MIGNLENTQFSCQDWFDFRVDLYSQNIKYGIYMDIDPSGQNTGKVRIWDYNLQTSLIEYPASTGFGALFGTSLSIKFSKVGSGSNYLRIFY